MNMDTEMSAQIAYNIGYEDAKWYHEERGAEQCAEYADEYEHGYCDALDIADEDWFDAHPLTDEDFVKYGL